MYIYIYIYMSTWNVTWERSHPLLLLVHPLSTAATCKVRRRENMVGVNMVLAEFV